MPLVHSFDLPERLVVGTVGAPGQRAFFLQARSGPRTVTVALEKQQVQVLAERLDELLDEVMAQSGNDTVVPALAPHALRDDAPLEFPIAEEFRAGTMTLSWDPNAEQVVVEVFSVVLLDPEAPEAAADEEGEPDELLVVRTTAAQARAFVERAQRVVEAGRPDCPFCGEPLDPRGHLCVRANGFKRRAP